MYILLESDTTDEKALSKISSWDAMGYTKSSDVANAWAVSSEYRCIQYCPDKEVTEV